MNRILVTSSLLVVLGAACFTGLGSLTPFPCAEDGTCPDGFSCRFDPDRGAPLCFAGNLPDVQPDAGGTGGADGGGAVDCTGSERSCEGQCTDVTTSTAHCGECGNACGEGVTCAAGVCSGCVDPAATECSDGCADLSSSEQHCGACGNACAGECVDGQCATVLAASAGTASTCALLLGGTVRCAGANQVGNLGNGTTEDATTFVPVSGVADAIRISNGHQFACAVLGGGSIFCWGINNSGQLGRGTTTAFEIIPAAVSDISTGTDVSAGGVHSCAILADQTARCWGRNSRGQLGNGSTTHSSTPVTVSGLTGVVAISASPPAIANQQIFHSCAVLSTGEVKCWGDSSQGQVGPGGSGTYNTTPVSVSGVAGAIDVEAHEGFSCALLGSDGSVRCWGRNELGQLGNGTFVNSATPVRVSGLAGVVSLAGSRGKMCGATSDGSVWCWGGGVGVPERLPLLANAESLTVASSHACIVRTGGGLQCWGGNSAGQLSTGSTSSAPTPVTVVDLTGAASVSVGLLSACSLGTDRQVRCWGHNGHGELGIGFGGGERLRPTTVTTRVPARQLSQGSYHACASLTDDTVQCWGNNGQRQLGTPTVNNELSPADVAGITGAREVAAGGGFTCALLEDSTVRCWGLNDNGQLGDGTATNSATPVQVVGVSGAVSIAAGNAHACAVLGEGGIICWGRNANGELGNGQTMTWQPPSPVLDVATAKRVVAGSQYTCALLADGAVRCWGTNTRGQLGNGTTTGSARPVAVVGLTGVTQLGSSSGGSSTCATLQDRTVRCWGRNRYGAVGDGTTTDALIPTPVVGLNDAVHVSTGSTFSCASRIDGTVRCWGDNSYTQLGTVEGPPVTW